MKTLYIFALILFSVIGSAAVNLQLFQDGGSYLFELLVSHSAIRHYRLSVVLIQAPAIVASKLLVTLQIDPATSLQILRLIFSLSYSMIPFISLGISWLVLRNRNESLFIWPTLVILFINLVNFSWVSELLISLQLACPLLLASILIPGTTSFWILTITLLPIIFLLHPLASLPFFTIAIGSAYVGHKNIQLRKAAWLSAIVFLTAAVLRGLVSLYQLDPYQQSFLEWGTMNDYLFVTSTENLFFLATSLTISLICLLSRSIVNSIDTEVLLLLITATQTFGIVLFLLNLHFLPRPSKILILVSLGIIILYQYYCYVSSRYELRTLYVSCANLALIAGCLLLSQYFSGAGKFSLKTGLTLFASMLILLMASVDSLREVSRFECIQRVRLILAFSVIFALVVISKSLIWHFSVQRLEQALSMTTTICTELSSQDFTWLQGNPYNIINNWALPTLALVIQDGSPRKLLLEKGDCKLFYESGAVQIDPWTSISKDLLGPSLS